MCLRDAYQHFGIIHEILCTLNFFASIALLFGSDTQIGQALDIRVRFIKLLFYIRILFCDLRKFMIIILKEKKIFFVVLRNI